MLVFWILLGALLFFLIQRAVFRRFWAKRLSIRLAFDKKTAPFGEGAVMTERIENRKRLPLVMLEYSYSLVRNFEPYSEDSAKLKSSCKLAVPAKKAIRNRTEFGDLKRGVYTVSDLTLTSRDLFYTLKDSKVCQSNARLTVYPAKIPTDKLNIPFKQMLGTILTRRYSQEDPFELRGIRPYQVYDSMRKINWKASAKTGELKVSQYEYTTDMALMLILDMESGTKEEREAVISLASSLSQLFLARGISVSIRANSHSCLTSRMVSVPAGRGISHQSVIDEVLAQTKIGEFAVMPFAEFLKTFINNNTIDAMPTVITAGGTKDSALAFDALSKDGGYWITLSDSAPIDGNFKVIHFNEKAVGV